jgi:mono/diheme cytochrome c family protein
LCAAPAQGADDTERLAEGKQLFDTVGCASCHGYAGQGGAAGPALAQRGLPLAYYERVVRHPIKDMPPYTEKVLPPDKLAAIHAYLARLGQVKRTK